MLKLTLHRSPLAWAAIVSISASAWAQPVTPPAPDTPPAAVAPRPGPPLDARVPRVRPVAPPGEESAVEATASGRVVRWLPNPNGEVDGLLLDDGTQVAIAPMLSARLLDAVKLQDKVQILGRSGANPKVMRAMRITNVNSGHTVAADASDGDARPPLPGSRDALSAMTASGRIATLLYTDRGDANGVLLDNGEAVRFPPHVGAQLATDLKVGGTLYARGYGTRSAQGAAFEATQIGTSEANAQEVFPPRPPIDPR